MDMAHFVGELWGNAIRAQLSNFNSLSESDLDKNYFKVKIERVIMQISGFIYHVN